MKAFTGIQGNDLGSVLRAYRKANNLTQKKVADYLGIERTTYVKYETTRKPDMEVILKLASFYQVSLDEFMKSFFNETGSPVVEVGKADSKTLTEVDEREMRLLTLYRESLRKSEIIRAAEEIFNHDREIVEEINDV